MNDSAPSVWVDFSLASPQSHHRMGAVKMRIELTRDRYSARIAAGYILDIYRGIEAMVVG